MGDYRFLFVVNGQCLKGLEIPITNNLMLNHLKPQPNLKVLNINYCTKIRSKGIAAFGNQCKSLVHLKRNSHPAVDNSLIDESEAVAIANTMPNLQRIDIRGC